jgi:hypothetical protein
MLSVYPHLPTSECMNPSLWNLLCVSWHLSPSQWCTSWISHNSLSVCMWIPLSWLGNCLIQLFMRQWIYGNNIRIVGLIVFYAICVVSMEIRKFVLPRTSGFLKHLFFILKNKCIHKNGLGHAHPAYNIYILCHLLWTYGIQHNSSSHQR